MFKNRVKEAFPYLCTPIVGATKEELLNELQKVKGKGPDMIEWRVDHFHEIGNFTKVVEIADTIKEAIGNVPLLFTIRSVAEGGNPTPLSPEEILKLLTYICENSSVDIIDYEIQNPEDYTVHLREISQQYGKSLILSYHDFNQTPSNEDLLSTLKKAEELRADVAKVAVMPKTHQDVIRLLDVTNQANEVLGIPIATMSMNNLGAITRMAGWIFGSMIVFTVGANSSAPGQVPIEEIRRIIKMMKEYQQ